MFDYTTSAIEIVIKDLKRLSFIISLISTAIMCGYYVYASIAGIGKLYLTIPMASLSFAYLVFMLIALKVKFGRIKKWIGNSYIVVRTILGATALGFTIYEIYLAASNVKPLSIVLASLSTIFFVIMAVLHIALWVLGPRARLLAAGVMQDMTDNIFPKLNVIRNIKGEDKLDFDMSVFAKEVKTLEPMAEQKKAARKKAKAETWGKRVPLLKLFVKDKNKNEEEEEGE